MFKFTTVLVSLSLLLVQPVEVVATFPTALTVSISVSWIHFYIVFRSHQIHLESIISRLTSCILFIFLEPSNLVGGRFRLQISRSFLWFASVWRIHFVASLLCRLGGSLQWSSRQDRCGLPRTTAWCRWKYAVLANLYSHGRWGRMFVHDQGTECHEPWRCSGDYCRQ